MELINLEAYETIIEKPQELYFLNSLETTTNDSFIHDNKIELKFTEYYHQFFKNPDVNISESLILAEVPKERKDSSLYQLLHNHKKPYLFKGDFKECTYREGDALYRLDVDDVKFAINPKTKKLCYLIFIRPN